MWPNQLNPVVAALAHNAGVHFAYDMRLMTDADRVAVAMDAQSALVSVSNSGIPAFLSTFIDPKVIDVLVSPLKAVSVVGEEAKKGDWVTETAMFPIVESTGQTTSYGDYNNNGMTGVNFSFPQRQSYHYQTISQWGEKEMARAGLAKIDYANRISIASILTLNKYQNYTYFFGVSGLQNYGLLNDPNLSAALTPITKAAGGTRWILADGTINATANEVYRDIQRLYYKLQSQSNGTINLETPMTLAMSPKAQVALTITNDFNVNVATLLKENYPNLSLKTAPEYSTASGELVQLFADEVEGQRTATCAFTEKMRAHPVIVDLSSFRQKKSQGTWGTVIFRPFLIAQLLGV